MDRTLGTMGGVVAALFLAACTAAPAPAGAGPGSSGSGVGGAASPAPASGPPAPVRGVTFSDAAGPGATGSEVLDGGVLVTAPPPQACPKDAYAGLVGQTEARARTALQGLATPVRFVCWNCQITQDFSAARLNVVLDRAGLVDSLSCG